MRSVEAGSAAAGGTAAGDADRLAGDPNRPSVPGAGQPPQEKAVQFGLDSPGRSSMRKRLTPCQPAGPAACVAAVHRARQQHVLGADQHGVGADVAKAPDIAWPCSVRNMYRISSTEQRRGFRHELASTLGLFAVLQRHEPDHSALIGPWRQLFEAMEEESTPAVPERVEPTPIEREIVDLSADEFDLLAYLVCAHHGKVRMAWHSSPADQQSDDATLRIRGVLEGDILPSVQLADAEGELLQLPATVLDLSPSAAGLSPRTGKSWTERVLALLDRFGPFTLAWLETVLRASDQRASNQPVADHPLEKNHADQHVAGSRRALAQPVGGGTQTPSHRRDSGPRSPVDGDGERAGGRELDSATTRPPHAATRYIDTALGILSQAIVSSPRTSRSAWRTPTSPSSTGHSRDRGAAGDRP